MHIDFGKVSFVLGVIGMCFIWTTFLVVPGGVIWIIFLLPIGILAIVFGAIGSIRKKSNENYGLIGLLLGILLIVLGFIFVIISTLLLAALKL